MTRFLRAATLALILPGAALAQTPAPPQEKGLSAPVISLTPVLARNADALGLNPGQREALKSFLAVMPARRAALEDETAALRAQMQAAIVADAPAAEREALARQIGDNETRLILMRSACADHWRSVLTADQFARLLQLAGAK